MYLSWIILGVLAILVVLLLEFKDLKHRFFFFGMVGLLIFLLGTFSFVAFTGGADLTSFDGIVGAGKMYLSWLDSFFGNLGQVTTYAVKQNWGLNSTG